MAAEGLPASRLTRTVSRQEHCHPMVSPVQMVLSAPGTVECDPESHTHTSQSGALRSSRITDLWQSLKSWFRASCGCSVCCRGPHSACQKGHPRPCPGLGVGSIILAMRWRTEVRSLPESRRAAAGGGPGQPSPVLALLAPTPADLGTSTRLPKLHSSQNRPLPTLPPPQCLLSLATNPLTPA